MQVKIVGVKSMELEMYRGNFVFETTEHVSLCFVLLFCVLFFMFYVYFLFFILFLFFIYDFSIETN